MADTPHTLAPPNYRKRDINPMTEILAEKGALSEFEGPPVVNLTAGVPAYGIIAVETLETFSYNFASQDQWLLGVYIEYTGDNGAFRLDGINGIVTAEALISGTTILVAAIPGSNSGETLDLDISALAANAGVPKAGVLTIYDRYTAGPFTLSRVVKTLSLSKTFTP